MVVPWGRWNESPHRGDTVRERSNKSMKNSTFHKAVRVLDGASLQYKIHGLSKNS